MPCRGSGQDAELSPGLPWPVPRFEVADGVVRDRLTGLQWLEDANPFEWPLSWHEAREQVARLAREGFGGHHDWRLPNRRELRSLVSHESCNPALPQAHPFQGIFLGWYWSSTTASRNSGYAWSLQIAGGRLFFDARDHPALTWPCRGTSSVLPLTGDPVEPPTGVPWPAPRFRTEGDVVEDRLTGLRWLRCAACAGGAVDWPAALDHVREVTRQGTGGITAWRLPTINELESLVDAGRHDPSLPAGHPFVDVRAGYWSSTTSAFDPAWAMVLHLDRGAVGVGIKRDPRFALWPVAS